MNRFGKVLLAVLLVTPALASAQRPSATVNTRSALLYLDRAEKTQVAAERQKLYASALEMSLKGVTADPDNSKTWFTLGQVYARQGDALGADSAFDRAEKLWPDYLKETEPERIRAYLTAFNAGVTAAQANKIDEAIKNLEAANAVYGKKPTASLNLANFYARNNNAEKAAAAYRTALAIMRGEHRKGLPAAEEKQWVQWEEAAAFNLAQVLATAGKDAEAAEAYVEFLKTNPNNITAKSNLAVVYTRLDKKDEAQKVYRELLSQDLSDDDYFVVGVGLFRSDQYASAAEAFRKSLAKNPTMRDAMYNLAQAIYSQVSDLEEARSKAKPAELKDIDAKLKPLYDELIATAEKARGQDPNNRNVLALLARGYRGMADVVPAAQANAWKEKTLAVMTAHQNLPIEVMDVQLALETGAAKVTGNVVNLKATEGQPVKLSVTVLGKDGAVLGTEEVTVTAPKVEDQVPFTATIKTTTAAGGWKYEVVK